MVERAGPLSIRNNLAELALAGPDSQGEARDNLSLGDAAILNVGTVEGTVAAGEAVEAAKEAAFAAQTSADIAQGTADNASANAVAAQNTANNAVPQSSLSQPGGVATLDGTGHIPTAQIPTTITGSLNVKGVWNASSNTTFPAAGGATGSLASSVGTQNDVWVVQTAGTTSLNGIAVWAVTDQVIFNGGVWTKVSASSAFGTMSIQNANSIAATGGSVSGQQTVGLATGDAFQPSLTPDYVYTIQDSSGNVVLAIDYTGLLSAGSMSLASASIGALAVPGTISPAQLTTPVVLVAGDTISQSPQPVPDLYAPVLDSSGNVVSGYGPDGSFNVVGLSVNGNSVGGSSSSPLDAIDVRSKPYNAVGDAVENFCYATASAGPSTTLNIVNFTGTLSLAQLSSTTASLTVTGTVNSGVAFQPHHAGKMLYMTAPGGYTLQAEVVTYIDGQNVIVSASGITTQTAVAGTWTCPCFQAFNAGEYVVFDGMGQNAYYIGASGTVQTPDATLPYGLQTFISQISTVNSPVSVTLATAMPFPWSSMPAHLMWGANDGNAIAMAGQAAFGQNTRKLYFSGDGNMYLLLGMLPTGAGRITYVGSLATDAAASINGVYWVGDNVKTYACDTSGLPMPHQAVQVGSDALRNTDKFIYGRGTLKRCSQLSTINVNVPGDSQGNYNPQNQAAAWMQIHKFVEELKHANRGKTINIYEMSIGGGTYAQLADPGTIFANGSTPTDGWTVPRPIVGTPKMTDFIVNANQTATSVSAPIKPDLVVIFDNGGNDAEWMDGPSMWTIINISLNINHGDAFGPTDIILQTDDQAVYSTTTSGNTGGVALPSVLTQGWYNEYSAGLIRSTAYVNGFGCIDLAPLVHRACFGRDPTHTAMRIVPAMNVTASPSAPLQLPYRVYDFSLCVIMPGANDATVWAAITELDFQISLNPGNKIMLRRGPNGNLWFGNSTWGGFSSTTCTISSGGMSLSVGAPAVLTNETITQHAQWPQLNIAAADFTSGMVGNSIVLPTGHGNQPQRNFIRSFIDTSNVILHDDLFKGADIIAQAGTTLSISGVQFIPQDSTSCPDVVLIYPDGTIFNTRVAYGGYVSATQATLAAPAPQALASQTIQAFIGRMGVQWFDTGFNISGLTGTGTFEINVNRMSAVIGYKAAGKSHAAPIIDIPIERYGQQFYPIVTPGASQSLQVNDVYVSENKSFSQSVTPWEIRGIKDNNNDYYLGGVGGHPASRLRTDVTDVFFQNQNLSTY